MAEPDSVRRYYSDTYRAESDDTSGYGVRQNKPDLKPQSSMRNTEAKSGSVFSIIIISVLAALLLGLVINSLNRRNTMYNDVADANNKLSLLEAENVRLQSELESRMSAKNVEEYAENVLNMQKIDSSQIKYIRIQTDDVVSIPQQDEGFFAKVKGFFDRCVEYFRG